MREFQKLLVVLALSGMCLAASAPDSVPAAKSKKHPVKKEETSEQVRQLQESMDHKMAAMEQQLQQTQQQLQQTQQQLQKTQQQLNTTQQTAKDADAKVAAIETSSNLKVQKVEADLSDVKAAVTASVAVVQKKVDYLEDPNSISYKKVRLTPLGYADATEFFRTHATLGDEATAVNSIPLERQVSGGYNANLSESGISIRNSRLGLRVDGDAPMAKLTFLTEMDWAAAGVTANESQTTSYSPRLRQAWGRAQFKSGFSLTAGQTWNLITLNRKGTAVDTFYATNSVDQQTIAGPSWGRWGEVRVEKQIGKSVSAALSLTNPGYNLQSSAYNQYNIPVTGIIAAGNGYLGNTTVATCANPAGIAATSGCTSLDLYSTNLIPDMIAKVAFDDSKLGHYEVKVLARMFRDRVPPTTAAAVTATSSVTAPGGYDNIALGYGLGVGGFIPVIPKKMDFLFNAVAGKGISRYLSAGQYDFVIRSTDLNMQPVKGVGAFTGFEARPMKKTEVDFTFGGEYYGRDTYLTSSTASPLVAGTIGGYGSPTATTSGCYFENFAAFQQANTAAGVTSTATALPSCTASNRFVYNGKLTVWYDTFTGRYGTLRFGAEYTYYGRATWSGNGGTTLTGSTAGIYMPGTIFANTAAQGLAPHGVDNVIMTTMRYIIP